jgi:hypothetical protein
MAGSDPPGRLVEINSTEYFVMRLDLLDGLGLHDVVDEKTAVGRSSDEVGVLGVEEDVHSVLVDVMARILLDLDASGGFDETGWGQAY